MAQTTLPPELPGYTFLEFIGSGGFAEVFRYRDALGRNVAVKVTKEPTPESAESFHIEANLMAKLSHHPNIVTIHQAGRAADGRMFLAMEECSRDHLGHRIAKRPLSASTAMSITVQLAGAVETAHRLGILHRDIKPPNILFTGFQRPALTDFGISVATGSAATNALSPLWAPPEQHRSIDLPVGPWSDVFSLGATAWAMLTGRSPLDYRGQPNNQLTLAHRVSAFVPKPTGRADVPDQLERVLAVALNPDPSRRYQSAIEFGRALQAVQAQCNESVTTIDVMSESPDEDDDYDVVEESGTRVSDFILVDPYATDDPHTEQVSGPTGGMTSPHDGSGHPITAQERLTPVFVAQHGRGHAEPGLRDFTSPGIPQVVAPTSPFEPAPGTGAALAQDAEQKRSGKGALVAVGVVAGVAALAVAATLIWSGLGGGAASAERTPSEQPSGSSPKDPIATRIAPPEDVAGTVADGQATFTWTNPDEQPGDRYIVDQVTNPELVPPTTTDEPTVTVPAQPGETCVKVSVWRSNGRESAPTRRCVKS